MLQSKLPFSSANEPRAVFHTVYGRWPTAAETERLTSLALSSSNDLRRNFRAVIGSYDHQTSATPFTVRFSADDVQYVSFEGFQLAVDTADLSVSWPLTHKTYEAHLERFYRTHLKPGMTFVDVGANIGFYSMLAAHLVGSAGRVISFEPNSENCRLALLSVQRNHFSNIHLFPVALSTQTGYALFTTHIGSNGGLLTSEAETISNPNCLVVPTFQLDDLLHEKIDFIKLDVEGAEHLVLTGARHLIEQHRPGVTSEFSLEMLSRVSRISGNEYLAYFHALDYTIYLIDKTEGDLVRIDDPDDFVNRYGSFTRLEDLAFLPNAVR